LPFAAIGALAAAQHGVFSTAQAIAHGLTHRQILRRVHAGEWERVHVGVYRISGAPVTYLQSLRAACLAIGPEAAASHRAAAVLHGVLTYREPPVEISTTRLRSPLRERVTVHRLADLESRWVTTVNSVPTTTVARTLVDLGSVARSTTVEAAFDRAIGRRLVTVRAVRDALVAVARPGRHGVGPLRPMLEARLASSLPAGVAEARLASLLRKANLPPAVPECEVLDEHGGFVAVVDFGYPGQRLAVEIDGYEAHSTLRSFQHDRARDRLLSSVGWLAIHFTWWEVDRREPHVAAEIRLQLARRR